MTSGHLDSSIVSVRPFLLAKDFDTSRRFYEALGFRATPLGDRLAHLQLGDTPGNFSFLLQDFYVKEFAENLMMHLLVRDLDQRWQHIASLDLAKRFGVKAPNPQKLESWGLRVAYVWDPAGVLWHVASET